MKNRRVRPLVPKQSDEISNVRITLPVYVAYCGVARALRFFDREGAKFFAILVIPQDADKEVYKLAAEAFLRRLNEPERYWKADDNVRFADGSKTAEDFLSRLNTNTGWRRIVLIVTDTCYLPLELEMAADYIAVVESPALRHYSGAALRLYRHPLTSLELENLSTQPMGRLRAAFRNGRTFENAYRRLLSGPQPKHSEEKISAFTTVSDGPFLSDLSGYGEARNWGLELALDIEDWRAGKLDWGNVDKGALIAGPPGTGKSMYANVLAKTLGVPIVQASCGKWQEAGYLNDMLKAMSASFAEAKALSPAVLFIDEIDAIGSRTRTGDHNADYTRQVISRFLILVDEMASAEGVVLIAACNYPNLIDSAIKRSGRLDRQFDIPLPDAPARRDILKFHAGIELDGQRLVDFTRRSAGMTGADVERVVREGRRKARRLNEVFSLDHVVRLLPDLRTLSPASLKVVAVHELGHAIVALSVPHAHLNGVSIKDQILDSGRNEIAGIASISIDENLPRGRDYYLSMILIDLAGIAAEKEIFGQFVDGAGGDDHSDLVRATDRASLIEAVYGFGDRLTSIPSRDNNQLRNLRASDPQLEQAVQATLATQFDQACAIIASNLGALNQLADKLVEAKSLSAEDIIRVVAQTGGLIANPPGWLRRSPSSCQRDRASRRGGDYSLDA